MKQKEFKVLLMDPNRNTYEAYDILPYFRREWKVNPFNRDKKYNDIPVKTKSQLKEWVKEWGRYQFRARCEYEFLMALWPFGTRRLKEDIKQFLKSNPDIDNIDDDRKLRNIIIQDMEKIDAYEQIMMNIDIIVDILYDEFLTK